MDLVEKNSEFGIDMEFKKEIDEVTTSEKEDTASEGIKYSNAEKVAKSETEIKKEVDENLYDEKEEKKEIEKICETEIKIKEEESCSDQKEERKVIKEHFNNEDVSKECEKNSNNTDKNKSNSLDTDPYSYTKLKDFTSEIYKIELGNLPNYVGYGQLRKLLNSTLKLNTHKVKAIGSPPHFAFITFRNEKHRDYALKLLNGYKWKGKLLSAKLANPMADPLIQKRKAGESEDCPDPKKVKDDDDLPIELKLKNAVTPYWNIPYEEQLVKKQDDISKFLVKFGREIEKVNRNLKPILDKYRKENNFQCCPLIPIKPSPVTSAYRNKCEFTVGLHLHSKEKTVGFRLNRYKEGSMSVAEPDDCINISQAMLKAVKSFQSYVQKSKYDVYNPENHEGYWRQLTVRTSNNSDVLIIVVMHPQSLSEIELVDVLKDIKDYYEIGPGSFSGVTSVFFQLFDKKQSGQEMTSALTHLLGKKCMEESLLGMTFQVSPESFFQVNVAAAEIVYSTVADFVGATSSTSVLDICCGTGTISLCLAKAGAKVIGIEMCSEAVENARINAKNNNMTNVEFMCGKAEDVIIPAISRSGTSNLIAVVNPPRAGIHQKVLKVIRANPQLKKLVYVSCNANAALTNFVDFCRAPSNNYKGTAFYPVQAAVIDMFPHTPHKELVLVFERCDLVK